MTTQILINEQHLGTDATAAEAHEMVRILNARGYDVAYGDKRPSEDDENANAIPDSVWTECLQETVANLKMNTTEISRKASSIAGALWDDREKAGTLAEQLRAVAAEPARGTDGDLTDADRAALRALATQAE